jgi:hypothetical protein
MVADLSADAESVPSPVKDRGFGSCGGDGRTSATVPHISQAFELS